MSLANPQLCLKSEVYRFNHSTSHDGDPDVVIQLGVQFLPIPPREESSARTNVQQSQNETAASELEIKEWCIIHSSKSKNIQVFLPLPLSCTTALQSLLC